MFYTKQPQSTINKAESDFAVADTALIDKIYIADKGDSEILLQRKENNSWVVNNKYKVRKGAIDLLLETIKRIKAKHPAADAAYDNIVRNMAGNAKKAEIYTKGNEQPVKTYYIGGTDLEKTANYMLIEDAEQPYAVHIPGFTGYISGRYILKEIDWRDRTIFALRPENIKSVTLQYPMEPEKGFQLNVVDKQNFVLQALANQNVKPIPLKPASALNYLQAFRFLACEAYLDDYTRTDSLLQQTQKNILTVELNDGNKQQLDVYYIPVNKRSKTQFDQSGERVLYDVDRYYATLDSKNEVLLIQEYVFGKVLANLEEMQQLAINRPKVQNQNKVNKPNKKEANQPKQNEENRPKQKDVQKLNESEVNKPNQEAENQPNQKKANQLKPNRSKNLKDTLSIKSKSNANIKPTSNIKEKQSNLNKKPNSTKKPNSSKPKPKPKEN